jgi:hypothetical protein
MAKTVPEELLDIVSHVELQSRLLMERIQKWDSIKDHDILFDAIAEGSQKAKQLYDDYKRIESPSEEWKLGAVAERLQKKYAL